MKRIVFAAILIAILLGVIGAASAQAVLPPPRVNNPPLMIAASSHDDFADAWVFYPDIAIVSTNVENAGIEVSEAAHSCTGSTGTNSVWYATWLPAGKLSLDTAGSAYQTGSGPIDDTVMSLYRLIGDQSTVDFSSLEPVACGSNGTAAAILKNTEIGGGIYLVQISLQADVSLLTGSSVSLLATFVPTQPASMDSSASPKALTFPQLYSVGTLIRATTALDEPVDPLMVVDTLSHTVWFKFTLPDPATIRLEAVSGGDPARLSLFRRTGSTLNPITPVAVIGSLQTYTLEKGNYLVRVAQLVVQKPVKTLDDASPVALMTLSAALSLTPVNAGFATDEYTPSAAGSLEGWTLKNAAIDPDPDPDELVCGFIADHCGFEMSSIGASEKTALQGTLKLVGVKLAKGELIHVALTGNHSGSGHVRVTLDFTDASGGTLRLTGEIYPTPLGDGSFTLVMPGKFTPVKVKTTILNLTTTIGDSVLIDSISVSTSRAGAPVGRAANALPLPPLSR